MNNRPAWINNDLLTAAAWLHASTGHDFVLTIDNESVTFRRVTRDGLQLYTVNRAELQTAYNDFLGPETLTQANDQQLETESPQTAEPVTSAWDVVTIEPEQPPVDAPGERVTPAAATPAVVPHRPHRNVWLQPLIDDLNRERHEPVPFLVGPEEPHYYVVEYLVGEHLSILNTSDPHADRQYHLHVVYELGYRHSVAPRSYQRAVRQNFQEELTNHDCRRLLRVVKRAYQLGQYIGIERLYHCTLLAVQHLADMTQDEYDNHFVSLLNPHWHLWVDEDPWDTSSEGLPYDRDLLDTVTD